MSNSRRMTVQWLREQGRDTVEAAAIFYRRHSIVSPGFFYHQDLDEAVDYLQKTGYVRDACRLIESWRVDHYDDVCDDDRLPQPNKSSLSAAG